MIQAKTNPTLFTTENCIVLNNGKPWVTTDNAEDAFKVAELFNSMTELTQALRWRAENAEAQLANDEVTHKLEALCQRLHNKCQRLQAKNDALEGLTEQLHRRTGMTLVNPY